MQGHTAKCQDQDLNPVLQQTKPAGHPKFAILPPLCSLKLLDPLPPKPSIFLCQVSPSTVPVRINLSHLMAAVNCLFTHSQQQQGTGVISEVSVSLALRGALEAEGDPSTCSSDLTVCHLYLHPPSTPTQMSSDLLLLIPFPSPASCPGL